MTDEQGQQYQPEQTGMYELEFPAPQLSAPDGRGPVMIHALEGFFSDAGHAIRLAADHLKAKLDTELVASFAIDELLDYRSRRPLMTFKTDHFTDYDDPQLNLYALRDSLGTPFLLLAGLEPDLKWERFVTAVRLLAERLGGVRQTIGLGTIPMAVPPHPAGDDDRALQQPRADHRLHPRGSARCRCRAACPTCWSTGWPSTAMKSSASPFTCRTTWPRPTSRRPLRHCWNRSPN